MIRTIISMVTIALCLSAPWLIGCAPSPLAGGTETQNPEVVAAVKKMASAAFDAANPGKQWQPTSYVSGLVKAANPSNTAVHGGSSPVVLSYTMGASKSDTLALGDSVVIIHDTTIVTAIQQRRDTLFVNKVLFVRDTIADTAYPDPGNSGRFSIVLHTVFDSIIVKDSLIVLDTAQHQYKRMIMSVQKFVENLTLIPVESDTAWTDLGWANSKTGDMSSVTPDSAKGQWKIDSVSYSQQRSSASYYTVKPGTNSPIILTSTPTGLRVRSNQLFLSSSTFDNGRLLETVAFQEPDSLLSIFRNASSNADTIETVTINYTVDLGANKYTGADDRLLKIFQKFQYRFGPIQQMNLTVFPDRATVSNDGATHYAGMISITIALVEGTVGRLRGIVDENMNLIGEYTIGAKSYQVSCDQLYNVHVAE